MRISKDKVKEVYATRAKADIYKYHLFEQVVEIGALRLLGVKHRLIADLLNSELKLKDKLDRHEVSRIWIRWQKLGYITEDLNKQIEDYAKTLPDDFLKELNVSPLVEKVQNEPSNQWTNI